MGRYPPKWDKDPFGSNAFAGQHKSTLNSSGGNHSCGGTVHAGENHGPPTARVSSIGSYTGLVTVGRLLLRGVNSGSTRTALRAFPVDSFRFTLYKC